MNELMRIGSSAMSAAAAQLETTGQNIANAATPAMCGVRCKLVNRAA